ncbi:TPA: glycosyltransferase family 4 protein [Pseudomonas putida]|uniref:glycosyltransferase family 4 protein n=1 Tax=Pseudomonas putida TaxID=303 RepID=UPI00110CA19F|nr:glycosyltransferase family 4 protein [Pseudomonas putida]MDD1993789.1 glycosyltransferase family 4 protein [Pseudomonas putida]HDS0916916.1 glycosyltransferase family 4 protein [Pseudomonas putida]HDS0932557.1 glycosyltransferase family 4 protein [Pseudomonas putida]HDS1782123.1 glycosyltransferase family 4 protein [Pseudomonas putida]HDS3797933.1 glycosyltransferase family 4 protein [Pseudomonas putida]
MSIKGLRVARISTVPFFVVTQLSAQLRALNDAGADVDVIASNDDMSEVLQSRKDLTFIPVEIAREISPLKDLRSLIQLVILFRKRGYDIVHSTTPKAGLLAAIAGRIAGTQIRLHTFTGQPWVTMSGFKKHLLKFCDWLIARLNTHNFTDSVSQREFLVQEGVISSNKVSVIGVGSLAGVDMDRFDAQRFSPEFIAQTRNELEIPQDAKVLLFVGRVTPEKGIGELMEAFITLRAVHADLFLVLVGPYEAEGREVVESHLAGDCAGYVKVLGLQEVPEKFMAASDLLCLPSYREGFGTVVIEAAAMGLPTVGTDIYGLNDAVVNGETGLLVPVRNPGALSDAIDALLSQPQRLISMSTKARERARRDFDSKYCSALLIQQYEGFYK